MDALLLLLLLLLLTDYCCRAQLHVGVINFKQTHSICLHTPPVMRYNRGLHWYQWLSLYAL